MNEVRWCHFFFGDGKLDSITQVAVSLFLICFLPHVFTSSIFGTLKVIGLDSRKPDETKKVYANTHPYGKLPQTPYS